MLTGFIVLVERERESWVLSLTVSSFFLVQSRIFVREFFSCLGDWSFLFSLKVEIFLSWL